MMAIPLKIKPFTILYQFYLLQIASGMLVMDLMAVKRTLVGSLTIKEVSESLGISYYVLRDYLERMEKNIPEKDRDVKEKEEIKKLRKENQRLNEGNGI